MYQLPVGNTRNWYYFYGSVDLLYMILCMLTII
nr:MAG TPA: hypothetical protein [Caudoviricetes sp.]